MFSNRLIHWGIYLLLSLTLACAGGSGDSSDPHGSSGMTPFIQPETQADTGPDILTNYLEVVLSECGEAKPEIRPRDVRRLLAVVQMTYDPYNGYYVTNQEGIDLFRRATFETTIEGGVRVRNPVDWSTAIGHNHISIGIDLDQLTYGIYMYDNPICSSPDASI